MFSSAVGERPDVPEQEVGELWTYFCTRNSIKNEGKTKKVNFGNDLTVKQRNGREERKRANRKLGLVEQARPRMVTSMRTPLTCIR